MVTLAPALLSWDRKARTLSPKSGNKSSSDVLAGKRAHHWGPDASAMPCSLCQDPSLAESDHLWLHLHHLLHGDRHHVLVQMVHDPDRAGADQKDDEDTEG